MGECRENDCNGPAKHTTGSTTLSGVQTTNCASHICELERVAAYRAAPGHYGVEPKCSVEIW